LGWVRLIWYVVTYVPVASCFKKHSKVFVKGEVFSEFLLMSITTIGAFAIREYRCCCNAFYAVGEVFPNLGCSKSKTNIKLLLDQRPDETTVMNGKCDYKKSI
jgi:Cd2+/Zn2+-exporting ATPase